ncbi:hypothetical protein MNBD_GAMMA01-713 [hydrothermal vent metagenome]|uniref:Thymidine phosphorylase n=1 Tax=hydrothermal vent metagenome TaxID=652676 RepID=A0A3B0VEW2_9ZZZZ
MINKKHYKAEPQKSQDCTVVKPFHGADKLLSHIHSTFGHGIKAIMMSYFDTVEKLLLEMAEKAGSSSRGKLYLESARSIKIHKLNVLSSFLSTIKQTFVLFENNKFNYFKNKTNKTAKQNNLISTSFDRNDVNEKLVQNTLIHKSESIHKNHLLAFEKRFSCLIATALEPYHIPIGPYVLVSAFAKSIRLLHLELNIKLILYKHFEHGVMTQISNLYKEVNQYLNSNGIVTGLENNIVTTQPGSPNSQIVHSHPSIVDKKPILTILTTVQQQVLKDITINTPNTVAPVGIKNTLLRQLKSINQHNKDTINLVTMLFQSIAEDRDVPLLVRAILIKLYIPYLQAAILDSNLLANKQHPAQLLLEEISSTSIGWSVELDIGKKFINQINNTIDVILSASDLNEIFFNNLLRTYQKFIRQHKNDFKVEQQRIKDKSMGRIKIAAAMRTVDALLAHKMENVSIPAPISNILLGSWRNLLTLLLVRHSNTSEQYLCGIKFVDSLIDILKSTKQHDIVIQNQIENLCKEYEEGLKLVAYNGSELTDKINELSQCLLNLFKPDTKNVQINSAVKKETSDSVTTKRYTKIADRYHKSTKKILTSSDNLKGLSSKDIELVGSIKIGMWFEFTRKNNSPVKAQLSWTNPKSGKLLFVNSRGLKVTDKTSKELVSGLKDKSIAIIQI